MHHTCLVRGRLEPPPPHGTFSQPFPWECRRGDLGSAAQNQGDQRLVTSTGLPVFWFPLLFICFGAFLCSANVGFGLSILPRSYQDCQPRIEVPAAPGLPAWNWGVQDPKKKLGCPEPQGCQPRIRVPKVPGRPALTRGAQVPRIAILERGCPGCPRMGPGCCTSPTSHRQPVWTALKVDRVKARRKEELLSEPALFQLWPPGWLKQGSVSSEGGQEAAGAPGGEEEEERQVRGGRTLRAGAPGKCVSLAAVLWMVSPCWELVCAELRRRVEGGPTGLWKAWGPLKDLWNSRVGRAPRTSTCPRRKELLQVEPT